MLLHQSRIKDNAVHAGLSQPLDHSKVLTNKSRTENCFLSQNSNLLTARTPMVTTDAMVVLWTFHSFTLLTMVLLLKASILTKVLAEAATTPMLTKSGPSRTALRLQLTRRTLWRPQLPNNPSQSPLKPTIFHSNSINPECTAETAELNSTTVCSLSAMDHRTESLTGKLKIHGAQLGDHQDTSTFWEQAMEKVNAESTWLPHTQSHDLFD